MATSIHDPLADKAGTMSGNIARQGISAPASIPGQQSTIEDLLADYPELAPEIAACTAWRDTGQPDRLSTDAGRIYPSRKPNPFPRLDP